MTTTIYHNPRCSKSRQTLALLEERGLEPVIVRYLETPPSPAELGQLLELLGISAGELLRRGEPIARELQLDDPALSEDDLLAAMSRHPELIERPIVVANGKARIGRPPESVLEIVV